MIRQNTFKLHATLFELRDGIKTLIPWGSLSSKDNQPLTELVYKDNFPLIDTLLQYTCIPNVEQCKNLETRKSYKELIINPFVKVEKMKVQEFLKLQLNYKFEPLEKE